MLIYSLTKFALLSKEKISFYDEKKKRVEKLSTFSFLKRRQEMGWASLILGMSILVSRFTGLIRDKIISFFFGAVQESDLYFAAFVIPDFINYLLAGGYFSITLIPLLSVYFDRSEEEGWRFFSAALTWIVIAITLLTALTMGFAPNLAHLTAPGMDAESLARLSYFLRIIMPAQVFFLAGSCFTALLYMRKQFMAPALSPLIYNFSIIAGGILFRSRGMEGFCWGVCVGAFFGNFLLPYLAVRHGEGLKLRLSFRHSGLKRFFLLALPLMLGQSIVVLDEQLVRVFGSLAGTGAISWLNYARRIMLVPVGVVAQAAGVASYPFLAELAAKQDFGRFHQTINSALRNTLTILIPLSLWMMTVAEPIIRLIFEQGSFNASDTLQTALLLRIFLACVFCWGIQQILGRAFYAQQDTLTPTILGTIGAILAAPLYYLLTKYFQAPGVALASALSMALYALGLGLWWRLRRFGSTAFVGIGKLTIQLTALSLAACAPTIYITMSRFSFGIADSYISAIITFLASGASFALLFGILSCRFIPLAVQPFLEKGGAIATKLIRRSSPGR